MLAKLGASMLSAKFVYLLSKCRTGAIIIRGLYTFYALFEIHLCTVTFGLKYGLYSRAGYNGARTVLYYGSPYF